MWFLWGELLHVVLPSASRALPARRRPRQEIGSNTSRCTLTRQAAEQSRGAELWSRAASRVASRLSYIKSHVFPSLCCSQCVTVPQGKQWAPVHAAAVIKMWLELVLSARPGFQPPPSLNALLVCKMSRNRRSISHRSAAFPTKTLPAENKPPSHTPPRPRHSWRLTRRPR